MRWDRAKRPPLLRLHVGRDLTRAEGWIAVLWVVPRPDLMDRPSDQGRMVLSGLTAALGLRRPWWPHSRFMEGLVPREWRSPVSFAVRSDAGEIAERIALRAGMRPEDLLP